MSVDNYYMRRYGCTRNQFRRIENKVAYQEHLDGEIEEWKQRRNKILGVEEE
tara:strand:+ start:1744 stop:1899 length:156 start_codon:yes stop_codon:yes gene_type:complete